jgi:hypothetical protein
VARAAYVGSGYGVQAEGGDAGRAPQESRPPLRLEAFSALVAIHREVEEWRDALGLNRRDTLKGQLRAVCGQPTLPEPEQVELVRDLRRWYGWAATLSGWITPPEQLAAPCPALIQPADLSQPARECAAIGLRVNFAARTACCVVCRAAWSEDTWGPLASYVTQWMLPALREARITHAGELRAAAVEERRRLDRIRANAEPRPDLPYLED